MADQTKSDTPLDRLSIAPATDDDAIHDPRQEAGQDASIGERLRKNPESKEARLDNALDESMDASDPPAVTKPGGDKEPPASSGFDEAAEQERQQDA